MASNDFEPTIIFDSVAGSSLSANDPSGNDSFDVSKPNVGFVAGNRAKFTDETAALLRNRLTAAALALSVVLALAFLGNLVRGIASLWWLRVVILSVLIVSYFALRSRRSFSLSQLRVVELFVFGSVVLQIALMLVARIATFAALNDAPSVVAVQHQFLAAWCILILIYGIFMPNTWKRGAMVMTPIAIIPYILLAAQRWLSPDVASLLDADHASTAIPLPLIAALVGTYGTHIINSARREAFKARQFGQYRLLDKLGSGGMGEVYRAEHVLLKRPCAMKLIKPSNEADATAIAHFEKEVKTTAKLTHWNTIEIYDYGHTDDGTFYYVMELLPGLSLEELVERHGPLPPERVVHLLRQICGALHEAHAIGLIHRDIKPANVFAAQRGGVFDVAKLLDFGLVKERTAKSSGDEQAAAHGSFSGTPLYMSPEQASAYEDVDGRADIYSLGAVAYFLLTGQPPFTGMNVLQLLAAHANSEAIPPSQANDQVPNDLEQIVLKCLAKAPKDRYQEAGSLERALADCECADKWNPEKAASWWETERRRSSKQQPENKRVEVTVNHKPDDTTTG